MKLVLSIAGVSVGVMGLFGDSLQPARIPDVLVRILGTGSSVSTYLAVLLFLAFLHFPNILRLAAPGSRQDSVGALVATTGVYLNAGSLRALLKVEARHGAAGCGC